MAGSRTLTFWLPCLHPIWPPLRRGFCRASCSAGGCLRKALPHLAERQQALGADLLQLLHRHGLLHVGQSVQQEAMFLLPVGAGGGRKSAKKGPIQLGGKEKVQRIKKVKRGRLVGQTELQIFI